MASPAPITVIGIGDDGPAGLTPASRAALDAAKIVFGGRRHLGLIDRPERGRPWRVPITDSLAEIQAAGPGPVAVLASGDPSWFGIAGTLLRHGWEERIAVLPAPSAFSLAAARLGWSLEDTRCLSACGRPVEAVWPYLAPGARLLVLSAGSQTPRALAEGLTRRGYGPSAIQILSHLGGPEEDRSASSAEAFADENPPALNLVAIVCALAPGARWFPPVPGLPDEAFSTDGTMTKRVPRAAAISALGPRPGALLWDVGAGSGSFAVEWLRAAPGARALAIEPRADRRALIEENATRLCVAGLAIVSGEAPDALANLEAPDAVFFGGGASAASLDVALRALKPGGRLVAHGVTLETQGLLAQMHAAHGGELLRIAVEAAEPLGRYRGWRAAMPVHHWHWEKPR